MSTTRWIIETPCGHSGVAGIDGMKPHPLGEPIGFNRGGGKTYAKWCPGGSRIVVDPANLPPEAIQRAAKAAQEADAPARKKRPWAEEPPHIQTIYARVAEAAVRAFLSDPEPGDQT